MPERERESGGMYAPIEEMVGGGVRELARLLGRKASVGVVCGTPA